MIKIALFFSSIAAVCLAKHYPIQFSIPESKVVDAPCQKDRDFAFITPKDPSTYVYFSEENYYQDYKRSYFAVTCKKGGWDCMRHYEILANGCIPYFLDLENCPENTMYFLPKNLIQEAMNLPGISYETKSIDHTLFDQAQYDQILQKLLDHTRSYLTTKAMAEYLLKTAHYTGKKPILFLLRDIAPDYLCCLSLIGLKQILGANVVDFPKIPYIYKDYSENILELYGKGMSYTKIIDPDSTDRTCIKERIRNREFELIIYGSLHRGLLFHPEVQQNYRDEEIIYLCGEDRHQCKAIFPSAQLFLREFDCLKAQGKSIIILPERARDGD